jgi:hypothetical protein
MGHVGSKVSALVDGQLPKAEADRLWGHVHLCQACRRAVEREGWVKTRLQGLALTPEQPAAPGHLTGSLSRVTALGWPEPGPEEPAGSERRRLAVAAIGVGSLGVAVVGVLAMTVPAAQAPGVDRRGPVTSLSPAGQPGHPGSGTAREGRAPASFRLGSSASARLTLTSVSPAK